MVQYSFAPAGMWGSTMRRWSFSSPSSVWTAEISIHQQNPFPGACKSHAEIDCGCRLADAALLIRDGDHLTVFHGVFLLSLYLNHF